MEHPAGRKLQASDVELKGDSHSLDQKVQQPNEPSTNDGDVATIDRKQIAQKLIASTKQQSKMLAMNALLSAASPLGQVSCESIASKTCLEASAFKKSKELSVFYDFPAEQTKHLTTTNTIESNFATIRSKHTEPKGSGTTKLAW